VNLIGSFLVNIAAFVLLAVGGGLGTAWYMMESGTRLSTRTLGPWVTWTTAGRPEADPYTRAHTVRNALLPITTTLELTYVATTDSSGGRLHSACEYAIVMDDLEIAWWGIAAFDGRGGLIHNAADRYAFNSETVMREPDGHAVITLARDARAGNWLPIGGGSRITLVLTVQDAAWAAASSVSGAPRPLPEIQRVACR
jgi:hypothetical protein